MGTGITSILIHLFPYNNDSQALKIVSLIIFFINLVLFVFVCTCTILRYIMFPEVSRGAGLYQQTLTILALGLVAHDCAPGTKSVHGLLPYGCSNTDQLCTCE